MTHKTLRKVRSKSIITELITSSEKTLNLAHKYNHNGGILLT